MFKKIFKLLFYTLLIFTVLFGIFLGLVFYGAFGHLHTAKELKAFQNQSASLVLAQNGELLGKFFAENRTNVSFEQLPEHLVYALVATEDARYFEHEGVDSKSLLRVLFKTILLNKKSAGGGSTINQQLAKNMYGRKSYGPLTMLVNKTKEAFLAYRLEEVYSKEDILTLYLNTVPFGENVLGIESASRRFFNKPIAEIHVEEAAVLIGMLKANTFYNPRLHPDSALERRNTVLSQMEKYDYLKETEKDSLVKLPLVLDYANLESEGPANYFLVQVRDEARKIIKNYNYTNDTTLDLEKDGLVITTTLDITLQKQALQAFKSHLNKMQLQLRKLYRNGEYRKTLNELTAKEIARHGLTKSADTKRYREMFGWNGLYLDSISVRDSIRQSLTILHAGLLALDPKTGRVKAWVGGIDHRTQPYDQIYAQRQVASTFKPILYATALERGTMPCTYLENDPLILSDFDDWQPQNYDKSSGGNYSMAAALAKSMNIPTVNLFLQTPFEELKTMWKKLGFSQELENKPSAALGIANASIYELAKAYSSFANGGYSIEPQFILSVKTAEGKIIYQNRKVSLTEANRVITKESSALLSAILEKAIDEGTGTSLRNTFNITIPMAGKTGTSQDYADAWFAAYNPDIVLVTRVGTSLPTIKFNSGTYGAGSTLALPLVGRTLKYVQKRYPTGFEPLPDEYAEALACEDYVEDSGLEKFFEGLFMKNKTTLEKAQRRAERRAKRKQRREERKKN